jgi:preprotein translocase subunit SecA
MGFLSTLFGDPNAKVIASYQPLIDDINNLEKTVEGLDAPGIRAKSEELKKRAHGGESLDDLLPEAFALCREAAKRTIHQRHFEVQLLGGIALHKGNIAEMRTGEGKTLTATLAVYLNALAGKGVHVVTVNDYLARRDAAWMGQIYDMLGLTVGIINHNGVSYRYDAAFVPTPAKELGEAELAEAAAKGEGGKIDVKRDTTGAFQVQQDYLRPSTRQESYACDITYGTNNEYGFDFLRDNMAVRPEQRSQRGQFFAIIDEVDSILIDEARTPLIISAPAEEAADMYYRFAEIAKQLMVDVHYNVDEKMRAISLTDAGIDFVEKILGVGNIYEEGGIAMVHHLESAVRAKALFTLDKQYVVREGEIVIVDEFTGRLMPGRRYSEGLHQAIEAKEGVPIQRESQTLATVTFQNLFRLYKKLAGMTGTAATEAEEFSKIYNLEVVVIPANRDIKRIDLSDRVYQNQRGKFMAVVQEIRTRHEKGQPVLVGTISIEQNEIMGQMLKNEGVPHELLNAKNHEREAQIIAQAGRPGAVTIATNMAGRGVDIILGGNPPVPEDAQRVKDLGGLMVIGTERHESRRIDNQLRGRAGRQGDPGMTQFFVCMDDDLMRIFGSDRMKGFMAKVGVPEDMPIESGMVSKSIESAQKKVEGHHFDTRKHLLEYDDVLNKHRETVYRKRNEILDLVETDTGGTRTIVLDMVEAEIEQVALFHTSGDDEKAWNLKEIYEVAATMFPLPQDLRKDMAQIRDREAGNKLQDAEARTHIITYLMEVATKAYGALETNVNEAIVKNGGTGKFTGILKSMMLRSIDTLWVEHLDSMEHLRTGIGLRSYGQRDPLVEYKREAYRMFNALMGTIQKQVAYSVFKIGVVKQAPSSLMERRGVSLSAPSKEGSAGAAQTSAPAGEEKVGRNDPCPCGSGKKYKKCHGA